MKLNAGPARDAGASSTLRNPRPSTRLSASMSSCVKAPSPDHPTESSSTPSMVAGLLRGTVDRQESAENREDFAAGKARSQRERPHAGGARVALNRFGNVAVRVGIAVQHPPERRTDDRQIGQVHGADDGIGWPVE